MVRYAYIKNGKVVNTAIFEDHPTDEVLALFNEQFDFDEFVECDETTLVGEEWDGERFWPLPPFDSWVKNPETHEWEPPVGWSPAEEFAYIESMHK